MMTGTETDHLVAALAAELRSAVNEDGGWGYFLGKSSRIEPTSWALLALSALGLASEVATSAIETAVRRLASWQGADGLLSDTPSASPNLAFNGLSAVVLDRVRVAVPEDGKQAERAAGKLLGAIIGLRGVTIRNDGIFRQDNRLAGWPWNDGTFSWTEPTAWCLLALKRRTIDHAQSEVAARIAEAERMLADRCCLTGGWNYGNSNVLGKELHAYVPTTAIALLAMQDRRALPEVARSVSWLAENWHREASAHALSLALIALRVCGLPAGDVERALRGYLAGRTDPGNLAWRAMALYALARWEGHRYAALRV